MTEIPEHLLKRSKERRAAIGGEDAPAGEASGTAAAAPSGDAPAASPAPVAAAAAAPPEPVAPKPKPVRPEVAAALRRRKTPWWAMPVLAALPLWAYVSWSTLEPPPADDSTPLALGEEVYGSCAACHGAGGQGISGPALTGVLDTWPDYRDHMAWVRVGSSGWPGPTYGAAAKPKAGGMPPHPSMTDAELAQVVLYERVTFGGLEDDPTDPEDEYSTLEAISHGETTLADQELGPLATAAGLDPAAAGAG